MCDYILIFLLYWLVQTLIAVSLLARLKKLIDSRIYVNKRVTYRDKQCMKDFAKKISLSPIGLIVILLAIYRNRGV